MIVSISRELGAGGLSVGEAVAQTLDAELLDERRIIEILSHRMNVPQNFIADVAERPPTLRESLIANVAYASAMVAAPVWQGTDAEVIEAVRTLVLETSRERHVVVLGHGGPGLLRSIEEPIPRFAMLLHASVPWRVEQIALRFGISREEARRRVSRVDAARTKYLQHYYRSELYNIRDYDLIINTERVGIERARRIASQAVSG